MYSDDIWKTGLVSHTFTDVRKAMFRTVENQLLIADILPYDRCYHKDGEMIIRELLQKGSISSENYFALVGSEIGNKLLESNVFALHFDSDLITFQSTLMARFCEQKSAFREKTESAAR